MTQDLYVDVASLTPSFDPYRWSTCIFDLLEDAWGHLCALTSIGSTTGLLCGEQGEHLGAIEVELAMVVVIEATFRQMD